MCRWWRFNRVMIIRQGITTTMANYVFHIICFEVRLFFVPYVWLGHILVLCEAVAEINSSYVDTNVLHHGGRCSMMDPVFLFVSYPRTTYHITMTPKQQQAGSEQVDCMDPFCREKKNNRGMTRWGKASWKDQVTWYQSGGCVVLLEVWALTFNSIQFILYCPFSQITNVPQRALQSVHIDIPVPESHIGSGKTPKQPFTGN